MNILELDSYNLADAVKFHNRLNPKLWGEDEHLLPQVREKLLAIAADFQEFLGVENLGIEDITLSGSNAAYSYTPKSDIDLHLVVKLPSDPVYQELFNAKKYQYNNEHNIKIGDADVELYVQPADQPHHSQGIYSIKDRKWIAVPRRRRAEIDDACVRDKVADLDARIHDAVKQGDETAISTLWQKIKQMRQVGLEQHGEFGCENIAFKLLRNSGCIKLLKDALTAARDRALSMAEAARPHTRVRYGFAESPDGVNPSTKSILEEPVDESPDGVNPTTAMFLTEDDKETVVREFIDFVVDRLGITQMPEIVLHSDPDWSRETKSFGRYTPETHTLEVNLANRHVMDILRTTAHELVHCRQNQEHELPDAAGHTGSKWENQANAVAGAIMRDYADQHPRMFENASGYIPKNKKQARDPRYSMALTVDIKPGQVGREANKLALNTNSQGKPALLMKTVNLQESLAAEFALFEQSRGREEPWDRDGYEPPGPEFPPQMPPGTTKIDVSDLTDWYRLGQDISDMDDAEPEDYNQGPPQTVVVFPSDDLEQTYLKQFKRLGLKTHDMDPDVEGGEDVTGKHQPKTDEDLIAESIDEVLGEIKMSPSNLRAEAAQTGALAGMEFEMIVPGVEQEEPKMEPDYDSDERCRSIEDAAQFFADGDYNNRRQIQDLRERMQNDFQEWLVGKIDEDWSGDAEQHVYDYLSKNASAEDIAEILGIEISDQDGISRDQLSQAAEVVNDSELQPYYDNARDFHREELDGAWDESDWLDAEDLDLMSYVEGAYDITWPHYSYGDGENSVDIDSVANDFSEAIGMPVNASQNYHGGRREAGHYVVEPDGSLQPDNDSDTGLEFVSPPMPIDQMLDQLKKVREWARERGCYTNDSTGLHINVSLPKYNGPLDFVKLALLLGDQYVLDQFGRSSNTYTKSALGIVRDRVRNAPKQAEALLDKMRGHMEDLASRAIHSGETSKYTSINTKEGYIEFRSPGGDWLDENFDKVENTLLRFTVALKAATDPEAYREEYLKKLYKLLEPTAAGEKTGSDTVRYFADYVAGKIPAAALRSFVKQAQLQRKIAKQPGGKYWWRVDKEGTGANGASIEVVAASPQEAIDKAANEWGLFSREYKSQMTATPIRSYDGSQADQVRWPGQPDQNDMENRLGLGSQSADANYEIVDRVTNRPVFLFIANTDAEASRKYSDWLAASGLPDDTEDYGFRERAQPGSTLDIQRRRADQSAQAAVAQTRRQPTEGGSVEYEMFDRETGQVYRTFLAADDSMGLQIGNRYRNELMAASSIARSQVGLRRAPIGRGSAAQPAGSTLGGRPSNPDGNWLIIDRNRRPVYRFMAANQNDAETVWLQWSREHAGTWELRHDPEQRLGQSQQASVTGSTQEPQRQSSAQPTMQGSDPGSLADLSLALAGNNFTGVWRIMDGNGNELHRFYGVGNSQGDANRVAIQWLRNNGYSNSDNVEVVPVMR